MNVVDDIRIKAGKKALLKISKKSERSATLCKLEDADSIALLIKVFNKSDVLKVKKFAQFIKEEFGTKEVFIMVYWDDKKEIPEFLSSKIDFDFITKKNLDWKGFPKSSEAEAFLDKKFDILIDLNEFFCVPIRYLVLKSECGYKVGINADENQSFFDLLMSPAKDFEVLVNDLVKYLNMFGT